MAIASRMDENRVVAAVAVYANINTTDIKFYMERRDKQIDGQTDGRTDGQTDS